MLQEGKGHISIDTAALWCILWRSCTSRWTRSSPAAEEGEDRRVNNQVLHAFNTGGGHLPRSQPHRRRCPGPPRCWWGASSPRWRNNPGGGGEDQEDTSEGSWKRACATEEEGRRAHRLVDGPVGRLGLAEAAVGGVRGGVVAGAGEEQLGAVDHHRVPAPVLVPGPAAARHLRSGERGGGHAWVNKNGKNGTELVCRNVLKTSCVHA